MASPGQEIVVLDGESYSLSELPHSNSRVVVIEKSRLLGAIDLEALVDDLGRLGNCVRIAYHGVAGFTELQIKIQRIGYDVTKLCDKSAITIGKFKKASSTVLSALQATYQYLLESFEDMALETLADVSDTAKGMAEAAKELHDDFERQAKVVVSALEDTQRQQNVEEEKKKKMAEERQEMETEEKKQQALRDQAQEQERKAELLFRESEKREDDATKESNNVFKNIANGFTSRWLGGPAFNMDGYKDKAQAAREMKMKQLEIMNEQQEKRCQALMKLAEYAKRIENIKEDESQCEAAVDALQTAIGALKSLSAVMLQAALFWEQMQAHCEELAKDKMKKEIEKALKMSEERRLRFWTSTGFKGNAVRYYAGWVALDDVCTVYMERIKLTQQELYTYIQEALRPKDAYKKVKELARNFTADLEEQQRAIADKKFKHNQEIKALQGK